MDFSGLRDQISGLKIEVETNPLLERVVSASVFYGRNVSLKEILEDESYPVLTWEEITVCERSSKQEGRSRLFGGMLLNTNKVVPVIDQSEALI